MRKFFSHIDKTRLETAVNSELMPLEDRVVEEIISARKEKRNVKHDQLEAIAVEYDLVDPEWSLPKPDPAKQWIGTVDTDIPQIMSLVMSTSNAIVPGGVDQAVRHLMHCDRLPLAQVFGLLQQSQEGPLIKRALSLKFQLAILQYMAMTVWDYHRMGFVRIS